MSVKTYNLWRRHAVVFSIRISKRYSKTQQFYCTTILLCRT